MSRAVGRRATALRGKPADREKQRLRQTERRGVLVVTATTDDAVCRLQ
ncbi:hypothetical protein AB0E88_01960 [Streptomyces sp. NPDC028635]